jgi:TolA-binding protein
MKFTLPSLFGVALLAGLVYEPRPAFGQSKELLASQQLQRDIYDLKHLLEEMKGGQTERSTQVETLLKQVMDANAKLSAELQTLQGLMTRNQNEQQTRMFEPVAVVKQGMEDVSGSVSSIQANLNTMRSRQEKMEGMLNDLSAAVRLLASQPPPQAAAPTTASPSAADAAALLFSSAQKDRSVGNLEFALAQFGDISQKYPESPLAPIAVAEMGAIYAHHGQYTDALQAYDRVLEQFGDNPMRKEAQFRKAEQLANLGRRADASKEFTSFARQYPSDDLAPEAQARAKDLNAPAPNNTKAKQTKGKGR